LVDQELPSLVATYKSIHAAPELSHHEEKTSALLAERLRSVGYEVTDHVGKYPNPEWQGYGVVAVMKNGAGPTVLVRADMDALPVEEKNRPALRQQSSHQGRLGRRRSGHARLWSRRPRHFPAWHRKKF